jgi:hypothetical protein
MTHPSAIHSAWSSAWSRSCESTGCLSRAATRTGKTLMSLTIADGRARRVLSRQAEAIRA